MTAKSIPDGYHTVTPYLTVRGAGKVIEFLKQAFGAQISHEPLKRPDGSILHAQILIGDSRIMIAEESEMAKATSSTLYLYVPNVDAVYQRAVQVGGAKVMEPTDMFYGDRNGGVKDPSGNTWFIATHKEDVAPQELTKRAEAFYKQQKSRAVSLASNEPNVLGDIGIGEQPRSARRARILSSASAALIARFSFSTISGGVPFGATTPYQIPA
jgi:uncharacterized glyoxalase superfamily protein PhnB